MGFATGAALLTAGASLYGAHKQGKAADDALGQQQWAMNQQLELGREGIGIAQDRLDWNKSAYDRWNQEFSPVLDELKSQALANQAPDYGMIAADTRALFDAQRSGQERALSGYGIRPGDGQFGATGREYGIGSATAEVGARQMARRQNNMDRYAKLSQLYGIGSNLQSQAMSGVNNGFTGVANATNSLAGSLGGQANTFGSQASAFGQQAGQLASGAFNQFGNIAAGWGNGGGGGGPWDQPFYEGGPSGW